MTVRVFVFTVLIGTTIGGSASGQTARAPAQPIPPAVVPQAPPSPAPLPPTAAERTPAQPIPPAVRPQTPQAPPPPPPAPPPGAGQVSAPQRSGKPINIKVEATITDQQGTIAPVKKTVSVVVADGLNGSVRTLSAFPGSVGNVPLNMDAEATLLPDGKIKMSMRLQYDLPSPAMLGRPGGNEERQPMKTSIVEGLNVVLENGKPIVAAQSADPVSDRQVVLEVKATVMR